jgi:hypothetical protein
MKHGAIQKARDSQTAKHEIEDFPRNKCSSIALRISLFIIIP